MYRPHNDNHRATNIKSQNKVKHNAIFFSEIRDPMSSQYLLQYKLYEIVKISLQFLVVKWLVFVDLLRCT
jgi:hypothetical protein